MDPEFKIPLQPGWNMVADPYAFDVPAEWIVFPAAGETILRAYNPLAGNYVFKAGMESRRGYFLWLNGEAPDTLRITLPGPEKAPVGATALQGQPKAASAARSSLTISDTGWRVRAEARCGERTDLDNWFGQFEGATAEKDGVDLMETPPPPGDYVGVSFRTASGEALMTDYRSPGGGEDGSEGATWTLVLNTNLQRAEARVSFTVERPLPAGWCLVAIDPASLTATDLLAHPELTVRLGGGPVHRQSWRLAAGPAAYVEGIRQGVESEFDRSVTAVVVGEAWPNPFRVGSGMEIALASPRREAGEVIVYDVRGRLVRRLFAGEIAHGWQRYLWDGRDDRGQTAAAGVYLVRATVGREKQSRKVTLVR